MDELLKLARDYGGALAFLATFAVFLLSTRFTTKDEHKKLADKVEALEDRVSKVEGDLEHIPDKETAHRMEMAIARLEGKLEVMDERLKPVAAISTRMQDFLMEGGR